MARRREGQDHEVRRQECEAERRDRRAADAAGHLEREDQVEADEDEHRDRHRSGGSEPEVEHVERKQVARQDAEARGRPGRQREAGKLAQEAVRAVAAGAGSEGEEEAGNADRERRSKRQLPGEQRVRGRGQSDREDEEGGEGGLGDEELRHALNVAKDLAPFGDHGGHGRELAADEHDVGNAASHLRAGALGDRKPGRLERRDVVDAVADHRHVVAVVTQRLDHAPFVLRRDAAEHGVLEHDAS